MSTSRKRSRTTGDLVFYSESRRKLMEKKANKRRQKIGQMYNLKKRYPLTRSERQRITNLDVCFLPIKQKYFDKIEALQKNREFRNKTKPRNQQLIGEKHKMIRYLLFWVRGSTKTKNKMLIEFNGLDTEHQKYKTHYVLKLGKIISTDNDEIEKLAYK